MNKIVKKFKILILVYIIFTAIATYFSIYMPIRNILKENALDNYLLHIKYEKGIIEQYVSLFNGNSVVISNDQNMLHYIESYSIKEIDKQSLIQKLEVDYRNIASKATHLLTATRYIDNEPISFFNEASPPEQVAEQKKNILQGTIIKNNDRIEYKVYSPIMNNRVFLGYDVFVFDITKIIANFNRTNYNVTFIEPGSSKDITLNKIIYSKDNITLYSDGDKTEYTGRIANTESFLHYEADNDTLFKTIYIITVNILLSCIISLLVITALTNYFIVRNARKLLSISENSKEKYKQYAIKDPLSGSYSRLFFEKWIGTQESLNEEEYKFHYTFVLIDIDNFKLINDSYGHLEGDKAIKAVSAVMLSTVRASDYVIRYGGDEFLIIFKDCAEEQAKDVMLKIEEKLKLINEFDFDVTISYGIHEIINIKDIQNAINIADKKMYEVKKSKRIASVK